MTDAPVTPPAGDKPQPSLHVLAQYVRDLSFENPNAPATLRWETQPKIDVSVDVRPKLFEQRDGNETFEVELVLNSNAKFDDDRVVFVAELSYAGLIQLRNATERDRDLLLMIEAPRLIFPYARRILSDAIRDGGFPPIMLDRVDFVQLYQQKLAAARAAQQAGAPAGGPTGTA